MKQYDTRMLDLINTIKLINFDRQSMFILLYLGFFCAPRERDIMPATVLKKILPHI